MSGDELVSASVEELFKQGPMTAQTYMVQAHEDIDKLFGEGYAAKHPDLVAAYMRVACDDFNSAMDHKVQERCARLLVDGLSELAESLSELARTSRAGS